MEIFFGIMKEHSDKRSDKYITLNNFGYYKNIDSKMETVREHGRSDYQIMYIDKGTGTLMSGDKQKNISAGNVVIYRPNEKQSYSFSANSDYYWVHFSGTGVEKLLRELKLEGTVFNTGDFFAFKDIIDKMSKESAINDFTTETALSSNILYLLSLTARKIHTPDNKMHKVIEKMQKDFKNKLTNNDYAKICGLSEYHFIRKFKEATDLTPLQYKTKLIIKRATELITTTELNISEIAHILGFDDSLYFSRVFKKETGVSPKNYLLQRQNNI